MARNHKKAKKPHITADEKRIIHEINSLIKPFGCVVSGIGPEAVGVLGDARSVGISVVIKMKRDVDAPAISTLIINRVRGIARVLMEICV